MNGHPRPRPVFEDHREASGNGRARSRTGTEASDHEIISEITGTGVLPSIRTIKTTYRVGYARAKHLHAAAAEHLASGDRR